MLFNFRRHISFKNYNTHCKSFIVRMFPRIVHVVAVTVLTIYVIQFRHHSPFRFVPSFQRKLFLALPYNLIAQEICEYILLNRVLKIKFPIIEFPLL